MKKKLNLVLNFDGYYYTITDYRRIYIDLCKKQFEKVTSIKLKDESKNIKIESIKITLGK